MKDLNYTLDKYVGIFFVNTSQTKEHCESSALLFGNEAHLRCMKNEAGLCPMKRAFGVIGRDFASSSFLYRLTFQMAKYIIQVRLVIKQIFQAREP